MRFTYEIIWLRITATCEAHELNSYVEELMQKGANMLDIQIKPIATIQYVRPW